MKPKKKQKKLHITEADFMLANRRAARLEEIAEHGRPVSFRTAAAAWAAWSGLMAQSCIAVVS